MSPTCHGWGEGGTERRHRCGPARPTRRWAAPGKWLGLSGPRGLSVPRQVPGSPIGADSSATGSSLSSASSRTSTGHAGPNSLLHLWGGARLQRAAARKERGAPFSDTQPGQTPRQHPRDRRQARERQRVTCRGRSGIRCPSRPTTRGGSETRRPVLGPTALPSTLPGGNRAADPRCCLCCDITDAKAARGVFIRGPRWLRMGEAGRRKLPFLWVREPTSYRTTS